MLDTYRVPRKTEDRSRGTLTSYHLRATAIGSLQCSIHGMNLWSLSGASPPDLGTLLEAIREEKEEMVDSVITNNPGILGGGSQAFGQITLLMIAAGHTNGLWVLRKYAYHFVTDIDQQTTDKVTRKIT